MNTLHYSIIIGIIIVVAIPTLIFVEQNQTPYGNFPVVKTQKLVDPNDIWKLIHPMTDEKEEYVSTEQIDWNYDENLLAFGVNAGAPVSYLWTMNATGKGLEQADIPIEFNSISYIHINGNSVFFIGQYNSKNETYQDIFRYDISNKTYSFVTQDSHVRSMDFMQNGNIIYVESHSNSARLEPNEPLFLIKSYNVLWMASPDGHKIKPIYNGTQLFDDMALDHDGNRIAFVSSDDPLHPTSNGTDIVNFASIGGPLRSDNYFYFAIFDMNTKEFTILDKADNENFANLKWLDGDHILYEKLTRNCVQGKISGTQSCPAGLLELMTLSDHVSQLVYGNQVAPYTAPLEGITVSPDGRSIIFGINDNYSNNDVNGKGIYEMTFDKPL